MGKYKISEDDFIRAATNRLNLNIVDVFAELGYTYGRVQERYYPTGAQYRSFRVRAALLNLDISHLNNAVERVVACPHCSLPVSFDKTYRKIKK